MEESLYAINFDRITGIMITLYNYELVRKRAKNDFVRNINYAVEYDCEIYEKEIETLFKEMCEITDNLKESKYNQIEEKMIEIYHQINLTLGLLLKDGKFDIRAIFYDENERIINSIYKEKQSIYTHIKGLYEYSLNNIDNQYSYYNNTNNNCNKKLDLLKCIRAIKTHISKYDNCLETYKKGDLIYNGKDFLVVNEVFENKLYVYKLVKGFYYYDLTNTSNPQTFHPKRNSCIHKIETDCVKYFENMF